MRSFSAAVSRANSVRNTPLFPFSASSQFSKTVCPWKTVGRWNLRPMPRPAISTSDRRVRSLRRLSRKTDPLVGRVLPVMQSMSVVLPAPFGPMRQRSSPFSSNRVTSFSALKPSKLTDRFSTHSDSGRLAASGTGAAWIGVGRSSVPASSLGFVGQFAHDRRAHVCVSVTGAGAGAGAGVAAGVAVARLGISAISRGTRPTRPRGRNSVTPTNRAPKT